MTDPTPTPAAPDWRQLCCELLAQCDAGEMAPVEAMEDIRAALATTRKAPPVPQQGEISVEEVAELASAVLAGAQGASPEPAPLPQLPPEQEFPLRLYQLMEEFDAQLFYTKRDDGIHVSVGPSMWFGGFMSRAELRDKLIKDGLRGHLIKTGLLPDPDQQEPPSNA